MVHAACVERCIESVVKGPLLPLYLYLSSLFFLDFQANNLVFHTAVEHFRKSKTSAQGDMNTEQLNGRGYLPHIIISNVEHDSIKLTAEHLVKEGKAGQQAFVFCLKL